MLHKVLKKAFGPIIIVLYLLLPISLNGQEDQELVPLTLMGIELPESSIIDVLKSNIGENPNVSRNWLMLGSAWESLLMYDSAELAYTKAFELDTTCVKCIQQLAGVNATQGKVKESIKLYYKTLSLDSSSTIAQIQLAKLLKRESKFTESLQHFELLLNFDTTNFYIWEQIGDCSLRIDSIAKGIKAYSKSFELNPANMPLAVKLINAYLQSGIPPFLFIEIANTALSLDSTYVPLIRAKGYLHFLGQDYQNAEVWLNKAYELGDSSRFTLKFLGINKYHNGSFYSSANFLEKAFVIDTTDKALNFVYSKALIEIGDRNKALGILDLTEQIITPTNEEMGYLFATRADAHFRGCNYLEAINQFSKAYELNPDQLEYLYEIGICHYNAKEFSKSLDILKEFIQLAEIEDPVKGSTTRKIPSAKYFMKEIEKELFFLDQ